MNKSIMLLVGFLMTLGVAQWVLGDDDEHEHEHHEESYLGRMLGYGVDVEPVKNAQYKEECGSCHFAYQPGLLPQRSWQHMMKGLDNHFGDNAELDKGVHEQISRYLLDNAADKSSKGRSPGISRSIPADQSPLRFSETRYFKRKHYEIPERLVKGNAKVGSYSNCGACHTKADSGSFDEHQVVIAGFGRWDD